MEYIGLDTARHPKNPKAVPSHRTPNIQSPAARLTHLPKGLTMSSEPLSEPVTPILRTPLPDFVLHYDPWGRLVYTDATGREYVDVEPVRAFPITQPTRGIALCDQ